VILLVAASERGTAQTDEHAKGRIRCAVGVAGSGWSEVRIAREVTKHLSSRTTLEREAREGDSPVSERQDVFLNQTPK
jgi:hypothetical protein